MLDLLNKQTIHYIFSLTILDEAGLLAAALVGPLALARLARLGAARRGADPYRKTEEAVQRYKEKVWQKQSL